MATGIVFRSTDSFYPTLLSQAKTGQVIWLVFLSSSGMTRTAPNTDFHKIFLLHASIFLSIKNLTSNLWFKFKISGFFLIVIRIFILLFWKWSTKHQLWGGIFLRSISGSNLNTNTTVINITFCWKNKLIDYPGKGGREEGDGACPKGNWYLLITKWDIVIIFVIIYLICSLVKL